MSPSKLFLLPILPILLLSQIFDISRSETIPKICNALDKSVLLRIKSELGNPPSLASWDPNTNCCVGWRNIECNSQGHVTSLYLQVFEVMHGSIPPSIDRLSSLTWLSISDAPNLSGQIPSLGNLTNLTDLMISNTSITGPIPDFLAHLTNLKRLYLSNNGLTGPIPNFLGQLKELTDLYLAYNKLTGPIPTVLSELPNLKTLDLSSNRLSGGIPNHLSKLKNLSTLYLSNNSLSGPIPDFLGHLPLEELYLSDNQFTGPIPYSFAQVNFYKLNLANNKLSGNASFLFNYPNYRSGFYEVYLGLEYNILSFDFSNVDVGRNLIRFNISHNMIYGSLPKALGDLSVNTFDVSYNQLCGSIPSKFKPGDPTFFSHNKCLCDGPLPACK